MSSNALDRAREMWAVLTRVPAVFPERGGVSVVVAPESRLCPPGWAGVVVLDGGALASVPSSDLAEPLRDRLNGQSRLADLGPAASEVLGPASLAYLDADDFTQAGAEAERLPAGHADVRALLAAVPEAEAEECGLADATSTVFVSRVGREVVAASAYSVVVGTGAHISVLTATAHRGRGLARKVASAAVRDALGRGLLPQWRARPEASKRVARALGFREYGEQISLRMD
ncbi:GNAT family N-acetyltransferase [Nonomuraea sp. NPDC050643]|uniref:GNAT family N-acetyltransferase n=1 Tax=Nonomuraea sp. NPDC050643 TaxID=3155660 RepID=UPI0033C870C1